MRFKVFFFVLISLIALTAKGQGYDKAEDENNLYWQPDVEVNYSHFQSESDADCIKFNNKYGLKMSPNIQLKGIVDIPESHRSRKIKKRIGDDKAYLAPIFCKNCSCILSEDSTELRVTQLLFDVAEMCSRGARKELSETKAEMNINNVNAMFYTTIVNRWDERMRGTWASIYQDVLIQKKDSAFIEWRQLIDELMDENSAFSTQPYEIERLINGEPIDEGYVQAKSIMGDMKMNDEN